MESPPMWAGPVNKNGGYPHLYSNAIEFHRRYIPVLPLRQPRFGRALLHVPSRRRSAETIRERRFSVLPCCQSLWLICCRYCLFYCWCSENINVLSSPNLRCSLSGIFDNVRFLLNALCHCVHSTVRHCQTIKDKHILFRF